MASKINVSSGLTAQGFGLAVHGYDVVSYFAQGQPMVGDAKYSTAHKGAAYQFASKSNLTDFESDP